MLSSCAVYGDCSILRQQMYHMTLRRIFFAYVSGDFVFFSICLEKCVFACTLYIVCICVCVSVRVSVSGWVYVSLYVNVCVFVCIACLCVFTHVCVWSEPEGGPRVVTGED
eukprot:GHVQ01021920.1.p1 GENE.GHVQ01021920.1~~GHVQ01021920.1.p1  ORF type:complete len:111 (-),score=9.84 GHVQ01021920.1:706-1038(-)